MATSSEQSGLSGLGTDAQLRSILHDHNMFPSEGEIVHREKMFELIKAAVNLQVSHNNIETRLNISFVAVPIGSHGLATWDSSSHMDCLVIGTISPPVFYALMAQKLRRPEYQEITVLRKPKQASGTALELLAGGVRFHLQYCAATRVIER
jgi:hypothetical protein